MTYCVKLTVKELVKEVKKKETSQKSRITVLSKNTNNNIPTTNKMLMKKYLYVKHKWSFAINSYIKNNS